MCNIGIVFVENNFFSQNFVKLTLPQTTTQDVKIRALHVGVGIFHLCQRLGIKIFLNVRVPILHVTSNIGTAQKFCSCGNITPKPCNIGTQKYFFKILETCTKQKTPSTGLQLNFSRSYKACKSRNYIWLRSSEVWRGRARSS
jgi:hypothetical protein